MKKSFLMIFVFMVLCLSFLTAKNAKKSIGLQLDTGFQYTNHRLHSYDYVKDAGFDHHRIRIKHLGGFNVGVNYALPKNWSVFFSTAFSFNYVFVNDSLLGFGYTFDLPKAKGLKIFVGGGFAFGGSSFKWKTPSAIIKKSYGNVGAGFSILMSYMFTKKVGIYFGGGDNFYAVLNGVKTKEIIASGDKTKYKIEKESLPDMAESIVFKIGIRTQF